MQPSNPVRRSSAKSALFFGIAALVVLLDQVAKRLAETYLVDGPVTVIDYWLTFRLAYNDAAAFSLGFGQTWILALIATVAILLLLWFGPRVANLKWAVIAALVLGGATGNWLDRLFQEPGFLNGHVIDYIQIPFNFPIFNIADIALVIGVGLGIIRVLVGDELGGHERK